MKFRILALEALLMVGANGYAQQLTLKADNIDQIVKALTLEEKAHLLVGGRTPANNIIGAAGATQAIPRLGIPSIILTDGPAGVRISPTHKGDSRTYYATGFPVGTALACTWNPELVENVGKAIGEEVLEYGCDVLLAPGMNIQRTPLCGRNFEYYSEDPIVAGTMAAAYVKGVQSNGVGTSIKHFVANSQETNRTEVDEVISQRALREIYLKGFELAVKEANPWTVMSSYNRLNGVWTQSSQPLLTTILRDEWGYKGAVMTDWTGGRTSYDRIIAGNDLLEPGYNEQEQDLIDNVKNGKLSMDIVDTRVKTMLGLIVKSPRFKGYKYSGTPDLKAHAALTRQTSTEGMVLLENRDQTLPLKDVKRVSLFGVTSYNFIAGGTGSGDVNKAYVVDLKSGLTNAGLTIDNDLQALYESYKDFNERVRKVNGRWVRTDELRVSRQAIERQAASNDLAIFTIGRQAGEGRDRTIDNDFNLTNDERDMLNDICNAFHAQGKRVVVILNMGNVIETASWKAMPDAVLMAWQPGQEGGNSVADILTGKQNPSGKLTMTFPIMVSDVPAVNNFPIGNSFRSSNEKGRRNIDYTLHEEGIYVGYRYFSTFNKPVSYSFGYGLSYTTFAYSKPIVKASKNGFDANIAVKNTGGVAGKETVQLYVSAPKGTLDRPTKELKAFAKTHVLQPGESQTLQFHVDTYSLASFNEQASAWQAEKGKYEVEFDASIADIRATASYTNPKAFAQQVNDVLKPDRSISDIKP
ncbi:MAG: glycoside hydrolase family 3 C-terminal domain-containing protein [Mediterranea sp.]|jgi:beta-glucosidase|nr:glycoside hydrolase family 3 C-terminal domain-containing protein [Mediterranea sp.]